MTRLVQLEHPDKGRRVARVEDGRLRFLASHRSVYGFALSALQTGHPLERLIAGDTSQITLDYDEVYELRSEWRLLPAFDHPDERARCLVSGTGLTHLSSGHTRSGNTADGKPTDGMILYQWGVESGRPAGGAIGAAPEWFAKGTGGVLRAHGEPLFIPNYARGGGEEAELAAAYIVDFEGVPRRIGFMPGNEFSDHRLRRVNSLYHAGAKHRTCSVGPEIALGSDFLSIQGSVAIERAGSVVWSKEIVTGEEHMCHSLANLEHHHFKYDDHRRPGDAHIHFLGATAFSFAAGVEIEDGDETVIAWKNFGRALRNPIKLDRREPVAISAKGI